MSIQNQRVIWDDDGTESDLSTVVNDFRTGSSTIALVAADDLIYIASDLPFNHRYFLVSSANAETSAITPAIWFANDWVDAVDVIDGTASSGATLAASGILQWKTPHLKGSDREQLSSDITGITTVGLFDMFWLRLTFSGDVTASTAIQYIGQKFSDDTVLATYHADLSNSDLKLAIAAGKTDWNDQHFMAAEIIVKDLRRRGLAVSGNQITDYEMFEEAACHKVAELVYGALGRAFDDNRKIVAERYTEAMNLNYYNLDLNIDGNLNPEERYVSTKFARR